MSGRADTSGPEGASRWTALRLHARDNVAVALCDLAAGTRPRLADAAEPPVLADAVGIGHKFALVAFAAGDPVIKYGQVIGHATRAIRAGEHVHLHNLEGVAGHAARHGSAS
jgi:hypothetical protein